MPWRDRCWQRHLLKLIEAHDCKRVRPLTVADALAAINNKVSRELSDRTVGS
jgi:hypothetical protein